MLLLISCTFFFKMKKTTQTELTCKRSASFCTWLVPPCTSCLLHFAPLGSLHSRAAGPLLPLPSSPDIRWSRRSCPVRHGNSLPLRSSCCRFPRENHSEDRSVVCAHPGAFSLRTQMLRPAPLVICRETNRTKFKTLTRLLFNNYQS